MKIGKYFLNHGSIDVTNPDLIDIGDYVTLGNSSRILTHCPFRSFREDPRIIIHDFVFIGYSCILLPGITIGKSSIIGTGAVVTKDIPAFSIAAGNPCKVIKRMTDNELTHYFKVLLHRIATKQTIGTVSSDDINLNDEADQALNALLKEKHQAKMVE